LKLYKKAKCRLTHLHHTRKIYDFGPVANHNDSKFDLDGVMITVADYFIQENSKNPQRYPQLKYPNLPCVNVGSKKKFTLIPLELVEILPGQTRTRTLTGDMVAKMIKEAAGGLF
jgi:eukaryotic translation initiation factor 2C